MALIWGITALLIVASAAGAAYVLGRMFVRRLLQKRLQAQASRVAGLLAEVRAANYDGVDKLLFEMRDTYDARIIEEQLQGVIDPTQDVVSPRLARAFELLGLLDRYLEHVRKATAWSERAKAAHVLGLLGDMRAVPPLLAAMRDPNEDGDVKLACADALGRVRDPEIIPLLCNELVDVDEWASPRVASVLVSFGAQAVDPLLKTLDSGASINARIWAAQVLGKLGETRAVPALIGRLHDRSEQIRLSVANALGDLRHTRAVRPLIDVVLRDPTPAVRQQAATALGRIGDEDAMPVLVGALGDPEYWMRFRALEAIEALEPKDTTSLENALEDANAEVRRRAALALERLGRLEQSFTDLASGEAAKVQAARARLTAMGRAGLSERLVRHLGDDNPQVRANIARILGSVGNPEHTVELLMALADDEIDVRLHVIEALGELAAPGTCEPLAGLLRDPEGPVRHASADALVRLPIDELEKIVHVLLYTLRDESDDSRVCAARVLGVIPGESITEILIQQIHDRYVEVRLEAVRALGRRKAAAAVDAIGGCLADAYALMRVEAADALTSIGGARAFDLLLAALPQADRAQRDSICQAVAELGFEAIHPALDILLGSGDPNARVGAGWILGGTGDRRAVPLLTHLLHDSEETVRSCAAGALGKVSTDEARDALVDSLADPNHFVRASIVNALGAVGEESELFILHRALGDPDAFVRNRTALAIGKLANREGAVASGNAFEALQSEAAQQVEPPFLALAFGLCGTPQAISEAVRLLDDLETRFSVIQIIEGGDTQLHSQFMANIRIDSAGAIAAPATDTDAAVALEPEALAARYVETMRNSQAPETRRRAAAALASLKVTSAIDALATALSHDPDPEVRLLAIGALSHHPEVAAARAALLPAVLDPDPGVRIIAIRTMGEMGDAARAQPLFECLRSQSADVVTAAETALAALYAEPVEEFLDWMMGQSSPRMQISGLRVLARIGDVRSLALLKAMLQTGDPTLRLEVGRALASLNHPEAIGLLLAALADPIEAMRAGIVTALRGYNRADVLEKFGDVCYDPSVRVRIALAETLAHMETGKAIDLLDRLCTDNSSQVRQRALLGLLESPDTEGQYRFLDHWPHTAIDVQRHVQHEALGGIVDRLRDQLQHALDASLRKTAVRTLGVLGVNAHARHIALALSDPEPTVRLAAIDALATLERELIEDWLQDVLNDPVSEVRSAARRALLKVVE
jgi:HEAT repeat protein